MRTLAVLPIKSFDLAKQRLGQAVPVAPRRALAEAMFTDVLTALRRSERVEAVLVVTADHLAQQLAGSQGADVLDDRREVGQSEAAAVGITRARELGYDRVLLVPGDTPALDPVELDALLAREEPGVVIVPDRHGTGTNALLLAPPEAMEPGFGPGSLQRHRDRARVAGVAHEVIEVPTLALDVDTGEDLGALRQRLASVHGGAAHTRGLLSRLTRMTEAMAR
ncbi:MAG: cofC [Solirubrobacterales bacterium]|nr:cofC [Solirubrobacterales bacterium]